MVIEPCQIDIGDIKMVILKCNFYLVQIQKTLLT